MGKGDGEAVDKLRKRPGAEGALIHKLDGQTVEFGDDTRVRGDRPRRLSDPHLTTHAQVDDERFRAVQDEPQELSSSSRATNFAPRKARGEGLRTAGGAGVEDGNRYESVPYQEPVEPPTNDLDLRKFGQCFVPSTP